MLPVLAESAQDAVKVLESRNISLVLTDVHMPGMDGFELAEIVRSRPMPTPVIMLTSGSHAGDIARCKGLGVEIYLTKPVGMGELRAAVVRALRTRPTETVSVNPISRTLSPALGTSLRILLAEDNLVNQRVALRMLEREGHQVVVASNGREALAAIERECLDLVLMDVQMPEVDGFEATAAIRARERITGARLPIIAMTAHAMSGDREWCLAAGMDGYVSKPISKSVLLETIASLTRTGVPV
jgi:CheY-like chemotaxis protein